MRFAKCATVLGVCLQLLAAGCTRDFSSFHFDDRAMPPETMTGAATEPEAGPDADSRANEGTAGLDGGHTPKPDASIVTTDPGDASPMQPHPNLPDASTPTQQPMQMPMTMPDAAADDDAGVAPAANQCRSKWPELQVNDLGCRLCACSDCAAEVTDCLTLGTERERMLCRDVLSCALQNHCQDYDCYCGTATCGLPASSGDGPCRGVIEVAAGGTRSKVMQIRRTLDPQEPFARAAIAISCLYGTSSMSSGPAVQEACATSCGLETR